MTDSSAAQDDALNQALPGASQRPHSSSLTSGRIWRLCQKELKETLRDRRTMITLVLMPILVYPILSMALQRILLTGASSRPNEQRYRIGVLNEECGQRVVDAIELSQRLQSEGAAELLEIRRGLETSPEANQVDPAATKNTVEPESGPAVRASFEIVQVTAQVQRELAEGSIDLLVTQGDPNNPSAPVRSREFQVQYRENETHSEQALQEFRKILQVINDMQLRRLSSAAGGGLTLRMQARPGRSAGSTGSTLTAVIPLVLLLMTITGAVYPSIDLTAGERERGTMEALVASPAPRILLLLSKYVAVVSVAVLTALANLLAMWVTLSATGIGRALIGSQGFSFGTMLQILPLLIVFACFFSAVLLALCSFAKSFKEAQAYLIPVMLFSLAPGILSLMPNVQFTTTLAIVPLVNIVLLSRDLMTGGVAVIPAFASVLSTLIYASAALGVAARLFGKDATSHGGEGSWSDMFRRPKVATEHPRIDHLLVFLAILFPLYFLATSLTVTMGSLGLQQRAWMNALITGALFAGLPALLAWYNRFTFRSTFRLAALHPETQHRCPWRMSMMVLGLGLLSTSLWMVAHELFVLSEWLQLATLSQEQIALAKGIKEKFREIPLWSIWVTMAVIPAACEEFFFRGMVLTSLESPSRTRGVLVSSLLFGTFHVISASTLAFERFLPTTFLGLVLALLAIHTRRIWPGILVHACHNGLLFSVAYYGDQLKQWGIGLEEQKNLPVTWLVAGGAAILAGSAMVWWSNFRPACEMANGQDSSSLRSRAKTL